MLDTHAVLYGLSYKINQFFFNTVFVEKYHFEREHCTAGLLESMWLPCDPGTGRPAATGSSNVAPPEQPQGSHGHLKSERKDA